MNNKNKMSFLSDNYNHVRDRNLAESVKDQLADSIFLKPMITFVSDKFYEHTKNGVIINDKLRISLRCDEIAHLNLNDIKRLICEQLRKEYQVDLSITALESPRGIVQDTSELVSDKTEKEFSVKGFVKTKEYRAKLKELKNENDALNTALSEAEIIKTQIAQLQGRQEQLQKEIIQHRVKVVDLVNELKPSHKKQPNFHHSNVSLFGGIAPSKAAVATTLQVDPNHPLI